VLTRVTQTHERPSAFRFTSSLQRIVDGLGEEWKSAHQRRLKQWSHKNLGALFVLRGEKHKDRSEAQQVCGRGEGTYCQWRELCVRWWVGEKHTRGGVRGVVSKKAAA
jgi:hypothetical protein